MSTIYSCPHCRTQNFATQARLRKAQTMPLKCWRCGKEIGKIFAPISRLKRKSGKAVKRLR